MINNVSIKRVKSKSDFPSDLNIGDLIYVEDTQQIFVHSGEGPYLVSYEGSYNNNNNNERVSSSVWEEEERE